MRYLLLCFIIVFLACKKEAPIPVSYKHFSKAEIDNLIKIVDYFESIICPDLNGRLTCTKNYLKEIPTNTDFGKADLNAKLEPVRIFTSIEKPLDNKIWFPYRSQTADGDTVINRNLSARGPYMNFLHELAAFNPKQFLNYSNTLHESGNLSNAMKKEVMDKMDNFDLENFDHRLFLTIHFLTISQQ